MSVLRLAHHVCSSWFVFYQTKNCFILSYLVQWKQWIILNQSYWDGGFFLGGGVALLLTVYFSSRFHSELLWTWNVLGNSSVCACMCVGVCARAAGFKPFSGPFFTTVRVEPPCDPGTSLCAGVWSPGTTSLLGGRPNLDRDRTSECFLTAPRGKRGQRRRDKSLQNYFYMFVHETELHATA